FKPKTDLTDLESTENKILDYTSVDYTETSNKMVDRNSWLLPKEWTRNNLIIPTRKILHVWDCNGVEVTSD